MPFTGYNQADAQFSNDTFELVWGTGFLQAHGFREPLSVENTDADWNEATDYLLFNITKDKEVLGLAFRAQRDQGYRTHTIRCSARSENPVPRSSPRDGPSPGEKLTEWDKFKA